MNIWEWLGIPQTTDIAKIKSAYARRHIKLRYRWQEVGIPRHSI